MARSIPEGYHSVTPYLIIKGAAAAIEYYKAAFGARERMRYDGPDGTIAHAEIEIGDSVIMLTDEFPQMDYLGPQSRGGATGGIYLYMEDVDAVFDRAIDAGGKVQRPVKDQFYGDRSGTLVDPFGHVWTISTRVEDLTEEEMHRRMESHGSGA